MRIYGYAAYQMYHAKGHKNAEWQTQSSNKQVIHHLNIDHNLVIRKIRCEVDFEQGRAFNGDATEFRDFDHCGIVVLDKWVNAENFEPSEQSAQGMGLKFLVGKNTIHLPLMDCGLMLVVISSGKM